MTAMTVCHKHEIAHRVSEGCTYCSGEREDRTRTKVEAKAATPERKAEHVAKTLRAIDDVSWHQIDAAWNEAQAHGSFERRCDFVRRVMPTNVDAVPVRDVRSPRHHGMTASEFLKRRRVTPAGRWAFVEALSNPGVDVDGQPLPPMISRETAMQLLMGVDWGYPESAGLVSPSAVRAADDIEQRILFSKRVSLEEALSYVPDPQPFDPITFTCEAREWLESEGWECSVEYSERAETYTLIAEGNEDVVSETVFESRADSANGRRWLQHAWEVLRLCAEEDE